MGSRLVLHLVTRRDRDAPSGYDSLSYIYEVSLGKVLTFEGQSVILLANHNATNLISLE
jgi:hypothetical protein